MLSAFDSFGTAAENDYTDAPADMLAVRAYAHVDVKHGASILTPYGEAYPGSRAFAAWALHVRVSGSADECIELRARMRWSRRWLQRAGRPTRIRVEAYRDGGDSEDACEVYGWRAALAAARALRIECAHHRDERPLTRTERHAPARGRDGDDPAFTVRIWVSDAHVEGTIWHEADRQTEGA